MRNILSLSALLVGALAGTAQAQLSAIPPNILAAENKPMVMLAASKDFTMFWKAYTDFEDIDFDGEVDRTFKPAFKYYGYFDPLKCYTYSTSNSRFEPVGLASTGTGYYCSGQWSGNFLNWISMSRIDVLRKVLYGGMRSHDTADATTLELSFVPRNSQAFVKYYNGADIDKLTPYTSAGHPARTKGLTFCRRHAQTSGVSHTGSFTPEIRMAVGNVILWNMTEVRTCNWVGELSADPGAGKLYAYDWKPDTINYLKANYVTPNGSLATGAYEHLPKIPAKGPGSGASDANYHNTSFVARVQVCVSTALIGGEKCGNYNPDKSDGAAKRWKPIGLLQEFGESAKSGVEPARAEFGLIMGSYDYNLTGGVLRKNIGQINDELNLDGTFNNSAGIIRSLNEITLYNYNLSSGNYGETCYSNTITNGTCPSWGNPVSELVLDALRYYANKDTASSGSKDSAVGLTAMTRKDPLKDDPTIGASTRSKLYGRPICRPLNMLSITSGSSSFDDDIADSRFQDLNASGSPSALTDVIGTLEGITGTKRLVGESGSDADLLCTAKTVGSLSKVKGVCADGPNFRGTYLGAGIAYHANTNMIRTDFGTTPASFPSDIPNNKLRVRNFGVSMSGGVATIPVTIAGKTVYITPAAQDRINGTLPGNMVDFKIISQAVSADGKTKTGAALVLWQHSMLGEDQDQDMLGVLRYEATETAAGPRIKVFTRAVESDTGSTAAYAFGYTIVGSRNLDDSASDGVHFHSGINQAATTEPNGSVSLSPGTTQGTNAGDTSVCGGRLCSIIDGKTTRGETYKTYKLVGNTDVLIKEPLWYIAKYGGFKYDTSVPAFSSDKPTDSNKAAWDVKRSDGVPCGGSTGVSCSDGVPDNYFVARSPEKLEASLREILEDITNSSNTAPAIASAQLQENDLKYVASFDPGDGSGAMRAYKLEASGDFSASPHWEAQVRLTATAHGSRVVITNDGNTGTPFRWDDLSTTKQGQLKGGGDDTYGKKMLNWLRGDTSEVTLFRNRSASSIMGPIVNSNPVVQTRPTGRFFGGKFTGYGAHVTTYQSRRSILWVGAGDGMLHAFDASNDLAEGGKPLLSYVPEPVHARLKDWASPTGAKVQAFVDGSPFVGDVKVSTWRTYLFSPLGRGGKGVFALDVTDPSTFTEANAASIFKWQFTSDDDADMGYVLSEPTVSRSSNQAGQIVRLNNGRWAALFGNGVQSTSGKAALFILFAEGPAGVGSNGGRYVKLVADAPTSKDNGLSTPVWIDVNNDAVADYIYAGDIHGNLWKFDVSSTDATQWKVAYHGTPLFIATDGTNRLPITGAPETSLHPKGGHMINVATGMAVKSTDFPDSTRTHHVFGIWDKTTFAALSAGAVATALPRVDTLEPRTFVNVNPERTIRRIEGAAIDWNTKLGWKAAFNVGSEMSLSNLAMSIDLLFIVTVSPPPPSSGAATDPCFASPVARLNAVDPVTGLPDGVLGKTSITVSGVTVDVPLATVPLSDQKVRIARTSVGKKDDVTGCKKGTKACRAVVPGNDPKNLVLTKGIGVGRIYWREIPGLKTR